MELTDLVISNNFGDDLLLSLWNTENTIPTVVEIYIDKTDACVLYIALNEFFNRKLNTISLTISRGYQFKFLNESGNIKLVIIDTIKDKQYSYIFENSGYHIISRVNQIVAPKLRVIMEQLHTYFSKI